MKYKCPLSHNPHPRRLRMLTDHLGGTHVVVDGSNGEVAERNDYYAFGGRYKIIHRPTKINRHGFCLSTFW